MTNEQTLEFLNKKAADLNSRLEYLRQCESELVEELKGVYGAIRACEKVQAGCTKKHTCGDCECLKVVKTKIVSNRLVGYGHCTKRIVKQRKYRYPEDYEHHRDFSMEACANFVDRTSPLEIGKGGNL